MYYIINVALNGKHLFATAEHSARDASEAARLFTLFIEKFPEVDGYDVTCTRWETAGQQIPYSDLLKQAME